MNLEQIFSDYRSLPEYLGIDLTDVFCVSLFGDKPIHVAATRGSIEELSVLLENGAEINVPGDEGYRPLHNAVEQGHVTAVRWLLENGADPTLTNDFGDTPFALSKLLDENNIGEILLLHSKKPFETN